jgi:hypothetical protein
MASAGDLMTFELQGGPMDGEVMQVPDPPMPWLKVLVQDLVPPPYFDHYQTPAKPRVLPIANYRLVRYTDGRLGYRYDRME